MGMRPASRSAILAASLSTQTTSLPRSAKTAPVTRPTYPVPTTQMFMADGSHDSRGHTADGEKDGRIAELTYGPLRSLRPVVVRLAVVAPVLTRIAHGVGQRI